MRKTVYFLIGLSALAILAGPLISNVQAGTYLKGLMVYGHDWTVQEITYAANNFNYIVMDFNGSRTDFFYNYASWTASMNSQNPALKILGYKDLVYEHQVLDDWATVNANESWFVHDGSGNRLFNTYWNTFLMDIGQAGYYQHLTTYINAKLTACPQYTGVYLDDVQDTIPTDSLNGTPTAGTVSAWHSNTVTALTYIKSHINPGKTVFINSNSGWEYGHINYDYINVVDGLTIEGFYHAPWDNSTYNSKSTALTYQKDLVTYLNGLGKKTLCVSGSSDYDSTLKVLAITNYLDVADTANSVFFWNLGGYYNFADITTSDFNLGPVTTPTPAPTAAIRTPYRTPPTIPQTGTVNNNPASLGSLGNFGGILLTILLLGFASVVILKMMSDAKRNPMEIIFTIFLVGTVGMIGISYLISCFG